MNLEALIIIVIAGVIIADLVANALGTSVLLSGIEMLWHIGINPTETQGIKQIKSTPVENGH
jgi:hypothetical protein